MNPVAVYIKLLGVSVKSQLQYRGSFVLMSVGHFMVTAIEALGVWALFDRFGNLTPWSLEQVALFYGTVNISFALTDALARGFDIFGTRLIKTGHMDLVLIRPRSTVLQIAGQEFTLFRVGRLLQGVLVLTYAIVTLDLDWNFLRVGLLLFAVAGSCLFFYSLILIQATISFWATESLEMMNALTYGGVEAAQYPMEIYRDGFRKFLTYFVPLACVTYFPLVGVLGIDDPLGSTTTVQVLSPLAGAALFTLALAFWHVGVRHYTSTGS